MGVKAIPVGFHDPSDGHVLAAAIGSVTNNLTAKAGGGQSGATPIMAAFNRFTNVATAADSGLLPVAVAGAFVTVKNAHATNSMNVFPSTGDQINALGANTAFALAAGKACQFFCAVNGTWDTLLSA